MDQQHATVFERIVNYVWQWIRDPFGRKRLTQKHSEVLGEMRELKAAVQTTTTKYELSGPSSVRDSRHVRRLKRTKRVDPIQRTVLGNQQEGSAP